jgi:glucokinase
MSAQQPLVLAGDVGGTHTRLALFNVASTGALAPVTEQIYPSQAHKSLEEIVQIFVKTHPAAPDFGGIGVAGPVRDGKCVATNLPWVVDSKTIAVAAGVRNFILLNDLEANAYGIAVLGVADFEQVLPGSGNASGNGAVVSAGTGLGEAGMYWDGSNSRPFATEGGHASFAPEGELQGRLFQYLAKRFGHVSCERVLSGPGLHNILDFLVEDQHATLPAWLAEELKTGDPAAAISTAALAGNSPVCEQAMDIFVAAYGAEAGNCALRMLATGGVYIGGGIAPKIRTKIASPTFTEAFLGKGRMKPLLETIPVRIILNENTALFGAARGAWLHFGKSA